MKRYVHSFVLILALPIAAAAAAPAPAPQAQPVQIVGYSSRLKTAIIKTESEVTQAINKQIARARDVGAKWELNTISVGLQLDAKVKAHFLGQIEVKPAVTLMFSRNDEPEFP